MHFSLLEHGVYNQLLDWYYLDEQPLPADNRTLFRRLSAKTEAEQDAVLAVLSEMFVQTDAGWTHKRIEREIANYKARAEQARKAGKLGGRPPKKGIGSGENRDGFEKKPDAKPTDNQEPITKNQEPVGDKPPRKRAAPPPPKPDDVDQQTWDDWLQLRKAKSAPVTETVLRGARSEAEAAGMDLDAFLQVWCLRGSQGLQADWLRPDERKTPSRVRYPAETPYQAQQLAQAQALAPTAARRSAGAPQDFIDLEEMSHVHVHGIEGH